MNRRTFWSRIAAALGIAAAPRVLAEPPTFRGVPIVPENPIDPLRVLGPPLVFETACAACNTKLELLRG